MIKYIIRRLILMIPVLLGITIVVFTLLYITPGDPARTILGQEASDETVAQLRKELGLDDPYFVQLYRYIKNVVTKFDFGLSYRTHQPIIKEILSRYPTTLKLAGLSIITGGFLGVVAGVISAVRQYSLLDKIATIIALFGVTTPTYWLALMLIILFSIKLKLLPASGSYGYQYWIMPTIALALYESGMIMRMTRSSMLDVIRQDYIRTARAKGQKESIVIMKHAFRNALIPIVTIIGLEFTTLLAGAILTESVFALPGMGKYIVDSISSRDYPAVQGTVLFIGLICIVVMLIVDIIYGFIDPKIMSIYSNEKKRANLK